MCGIAGYCLTAESDLDRTLAAQALLAGIAERGADAVGYAYRHGGETIVHKQRSGASALIDRIEIAPAATQVLLHVRDYTKGHPRIEANNHPIRHGTVVGVHNGIIFNDDELIEQHGFERAEPEMTVDSEAIFALAEASGNDPHAFEQLNGSMATAWLDDRHVHTLFLARGVGRPLWLGTADDEFLFASTKAALEVAERFLKLKLRKREVGEGTVAVVTEGVVVEKLRFKPDRDFEERTLPAVRAPQEAQLSLQRLAALASIA